MEINKNPSFRRLLAKLLALEDRLKGKPFPKMARTKQITTDHCGPAVLTSLFSFLGFKTSQKKIVAVIRAETKIKKYGLNIADLAKAVKVVGKGKYTFWKKSGSKVGDLETVINKYKYPVGVEWQGVFYEYSDGDDGHYAIVTRVNKEEAYLRIADPFPRFAEVDRKFKIRDFEKRWWDFNTFEIGGKKTKTVKDLRMMFVITPKGEKWPRKLKMSPFKLP